MLGLLAVTVGGLFAAGVYLVLRRNVVRPLIGLSLISHAANLLILASSGPLDRPSPILSEGTAAAPAVSADPLPQALILTAIVISFAVVAFAVVLVHRAHATIGVRDVDELRATDR